MPTEPSHLLLFDGVCHLCDHAVQWVLVHDRAGRVCFCPIQSETGKRLYKAHGRDPENPDSLLLLTPEGAFAKSEAVLELARLIHAPGSWLQLLKVIPRPWRDGAYSLLSRHRHRLFGKRDTCLLPQPEWRGRFLEQP